MLRCRSSFHEDSDLAEFELDKRRIQRRRRIVRGTSSDVFLGYMDSDIKVAVKEFDVNKRAWRDGKFQNEVAILTKVRHPNLVLLYGVMSVSRPPRIITEFCEGGCFFEFLHKPSENQFVDLTWGQQHKICFDVAQAVMYLHNFTPRIIHRDLQSKNLLLASPIVNTSSMPFVRVSGFGLSRMQESVADSEEKCERMVSSKSETRHWLAPEMCTGTRYDELVDVYSYSMLLFEVFCRWIPFEEVEPTKVCILIVSGIRPDLQLLPDDCPQKLRALMVKGWNGDPRMRPSFGQIVRELEELIPDLWSPAWSTQAFVVTLFDCSAADDGQLLVKVVTLGGGKQEFQLAEDSRVQALMLLVAEEYQLRPSVIVKVLLPDQTALYPDSVLEVVN